MATEDYVAVTGDDWYQRRRTDAEGRFFRKVADQGPRKGEGGSTRQGIYCFTADGELLTYRNHLDPAVMRDELRRALRNWDRLPAQRRKPGGVPVGDAGALDARYHREPPKGGLVIRTWTRILDRKDGTYCKGTCTATGHDFASRDHVWLTPVEVKAIASIEPKKGESAALPDAVAVRLARFHLVDNTRGEPPHWEKNQVRSLKMTLTVADVSDERLKLRLDGAALLATGADVKNAGRGFDVRLLGWVEVDRGKKAVTRFDAVAVGDHWGEGHFTRGARPGKAPLGIAFELAKGDDPGDRVPPQGARWLEGYYRP